MKEFSTELKVGIFAIIVVSLLMFMTFKIGGLEWVKTKGQTVYVFFENTVGLDEKTRVKVAGVDAGIVKDISIVDGRAKVTLRIDPDIKLYENARAAIRSIGLLGDKYLEIKTGTPDFPVLKDGGVIKNVTEVVDMDELARNLTEVSMNFSKLSESLNSVFGTEEAKKALNQTIVNLREITGKLNRSITVNDRKFSSLLDKVSDLTDSLRSFVAENRGPLTGTIANMKNFSGALKTTGPELLDNLNRVTKDLGEMIEENRASVASTFKTVDKIVKKIDSGEGSFGKLVKDERLYDSITKVAEGLNKTLSKVDEFRTFITFQGDYLSRSDDVKGYFNVTLQPKPEKYYILGVVGDPVGSVTTTETTTTPPGTVIKEEEVTKEIEFTAQFARRFGDSALRIGLTENTFGIGADYFFYDDKAMVTADVWDVSNDEENSENPHVRLGVNYFVFKNVFLRAGADNILNKKLSGGYVGMGLRFEDEDFKYIFNSVPKIPTK